MNKKVLWLQIGLAFLFDVLKQKFFFLQHSIQFYRLQDIQYNDIRQNDTQHSANRSGQDLDNNTQDNVSCRYAQFFVSWWNDKLTNIQLAISSTA